MKIILASASPRRQELLKAIFPHFTVITSNCAEEADFQVPAQYVMDLSRQKAFDVACQQSAFSEKTLVIGADTIVYHQGEVLGKPKSTSDAFQMLQGLSGQSHAVYTGVSVFLCVPSPASASSTAPTPVISFAEKTMVHVDSLTEDEINAYITTRDPMDKAGSYGIQGPFGKHITGIDGDYFNVVGLPVSRLYRELKAQSLSAEI